jgi:hypothetical protein
VILVVLLGAALGAGGVFGYDAWRDSRAATPAVARAPARDGGAPAAAPPAPPPPPDAAPPSELTIESDPPGARAYLDGTLAGETPITLEPTSDDHRLALILPGYKLYTGDIEGRGDVSVTLEEVTPPGGRAGIKVRCHHKQRYYVWVDGIATGQLCPTERIGVDMGRHDVEIYDPITDARRVFHVKVKETRLSLRVHVD